MYYLCVCCNSGCPEAVKVLVGNKSDLTPEVEVSQIKVHIIIIRNYNIYPHNKIKCDDKCFITPAKGSVH